ncbi:MAG: hypothetical protein AB8F65_06510 [Woeseiaceae bacterium]
MKYVIALLVSAVLGALVALLLLLNNPLADSPTSVAAPSDALVLPVAGQGTATVVQSSTGYPWAETKPLDAGKPQLAGMKNAVTVMLSTDGSTRDIVYMTRVRSLTEEGRPLQGQVIESSLWHVVVPAKGSFVVYSEDNIWPVLDALLVPFARGESWAGNVNFTSTAGPVGRYANVIGLSGEFLGRRGTAQLDQQIRAASASVGITDQTAMLYISLDPVEIEPLEAEASLDAGPETGGVL